MNTKTLLMLLLCGVCFACHAPQQDGQKTDLTKENKNMTNGELREKLALALEDMKAKAIGGGEIRYREDEGLHIRQVI